jgi:hypothetical protein
MKMKVNFFIIERLDQNEESDCLSKIYDLSILNMVKEIKSTKNNKINSKKISQEKRTEIIKVIKKTIFSSNFTYKWKLVTIKNMLIFFHIFTLFSGISHLVKEKAENSNIINNNFTNINNSQNNFSNSIFKNFFNNNTEYFNNSYLGPPNYLKNNKNTIIISMIINQISLIPIWFLFIYKYLPKYNKINDIMHKFTNYLLLAETLNNKYYFYYLMKDYSIFITKKKHYLENSETFQLFLHSPQLSQIDNISQKNIFLYSINIINDFILEDYSSINYAKLISTDDYNDIRVLMKYIESIFNEKIKKYIRRIVIPILISCLINLYYFKHSNLYYIISSIFLFTIALLGEHIFKEYYILYKKNIDKFIDNYNEILIKKGKFIYRKNRLIMFLVLKDKIYTKNQIINSIERIINY